MLRKIEAGRGAVGITKVEFTLVKEGWGPGAFAEAVVAGKFLEAFGGGFGNDE